MAGEEKKFLTIKSFMGRVMVNLNFDLKKYKLISHYKTGPDGRTTILDGKFEISRKRDEYSHLFSERGKTFLDASLTLKFIINGKFTKGFRLHFPELTVKEYFPLVNYEDDDLLELINFHYTKEFIKSEISNL